jgi:hypothetical protein
MQLLDILTVLILILCFVIIFWALYTSAPTKDSDSRDRSKIDLKKDIINITLNVIMKVNRIPKKHISENHILSTFVANQATDILCDKYDLEINFKEPCDLKSFVEICLDLIKNKEPV